MQQNKPRQNISAAEKFLRSMPNLVGLRTGLVKSALASLLRRRPQERELPPVDVYEDASHITAVFDLPGIHPCDVRLWVTKKALNIEGRRKRNTGKETRCRRKESVAGYFQRSLPLPEEIEPETTRARYRHGLLEVFMPKVNATAKKVPVVTEDASTRG